MNKKFVIIFILVLIAIIVGLFSVLMYNLKKVDNIGNVDIQNETVVQNSENSLVFQTSSEEIKLSPNAIMTFLKNYNECGHTTKSTENISSNMVNMSESELSNEYSDWEINKFTSSEVELTKSFNGNCGEHFLVKSNENGYIDIYNIKEDNSLVLKEETEIAVKYLADADIEELQSGVALYGKENLNAYIENFE